MGLLRREHIPTVVIITLLSAFCGFLGSLILIGILRLRQGFLLNYYCETRFWMTNIFLLVIGAPLLYGGVRLGFAKLKGAQNVNPNNIIFFVLSFLLGTLGGALPLISIDSLIRGFLRCILGFHGI